MNQNKQQKRRKALGSLGKTSLAIMTSAMMAVGGVGGVADEQEKTTMLRDMASMVKPNVAYAQEKVVRASEIFPDVGEYWATDSITWALGEDLVKGYPDGTFGPTRSLSEAEFAVMLSRFVSNIDTNSLGTHEDWTEPFYGAMKKFNLPFKGYTDKSFRNKSVDRGTIAQIIASKSGFDLPVALAVEFMYQNDLSSGMDETKKNFDTYGAKLPLQRDASVAFLQRLNSIGVTSFFGVQSPVDGKGIVTVEQKKVIESQIKPKVAEWLKTQGNKVSPENKKEIEDWINADIKTPILKKGEFSPQAIAEFEKLPTFANLGVRLKSSNGTLFYPGDALEFAKKYLEVSVNYDGTNPASMDKWENDMYQFMSKEYSNVPQMKQNVIKAKEKAVTNSIVEINRIEVKDKFYVHVITEGQIGGKDVIYKGVIEIGVMKNDPNRLTVIKDTWEQVK